MRCTSDGTTRNFRRLLAGLFALCLLLPAAGSLAEDAQAPPEAPAAAPAAAPAVALAPPPSEAAHAPAGVPPADVMAGNRKIATLRGALFQNPLSELARGGDHRTAAAILRLTGQQELGA